MQVNNLRKQEKYFTIYYLPYIQSVKLKRRRWAGHVVRTRPRRNAYRILVESQNERDH
jgi:hypothetical protein